MGVSVNFIKALFAPLFFIWVLTFNGRIVSGEFFKCGMVINFYNRNNPCTQSKCILDCGHNPSKENSDQCVSVADLKDGDEYEEIMYYSEEADMKTSNYDNYEHMVGCCDIQFALVGDDNDEGGSEGALESELEGPRLEGGPANQGPKFSCSVAFVQEESCADIRCIKECDKRNFEKGRCINVDEIGSHIQYPTTQNVNDDDNNSNNGSFDQAVDSDDEDLVDGTSAPNADIGSSDYHLACGCYPKKDGDNYICSRAFWHYTEENPCTENKCIEACIGEGDSYGNCLERTVIVVNPDYAFTNQDGMVLDKVKKLDDANPDNKKACCCNPEYA